MQRHKFVLAALVIGLATHIMASSIAQADVVADWNLIATETALPVRPGPSAILDLAMVHAAMHDAIQAFEGRFESYSAPIPNASGSPVAAAAAAAHDVLVAQFPIQAGTLDKLLDDYLLQCCDRALCAYNGAVFEVKKETPDNRDHVA